LSKNKDFEYEGKLDRIHQNSGDDANDEELNPKPSNNESDESQSPYNQNDDTDSYQAPDIKQVNDDDLEQQRPDEDDIKPQSSNDEEVDTAPESEEQQDDGDDTVSDNDKGESDDTESTDEDNDQIENTDNNDNTDDSSQVSSDKQKNDEDDEDDIKQSNNDEDDKEDIKQKNDDDSIRGKALNTIDPKLKDAAKLKDLSDMSKEEAKEELIEITKSLVKKKAMAVFVTHILPVLLPFIIAFIAILIILFAVLGAVTSNQQSKMDNKAGCTPKETESTSVKTSKDAEKNAKTIFEYEMKHVDGAKPKAVAAHLGNIEVESAHTFSPKTIQGNNEFKKDIAMDPSAGGYAFGFAQWDSERRVNLLKFAKKEGKEWNDFGVQLDYMLNHDSSDSDVIKKLLKSSGSVGSITEKIMNEWERAGDKDSISERKQAAAKYYSKFGKSAGDGDSNVDDATDAASDNSDAGEKSGCNDDSSSKTDGELGASTKANDKSGKIKEKWDSKDDIPNKYKKSIELPDFDEKNLKGSPFAANGHDKGQCTELTWAYMNQLYKKDQPAFDGVTNGDSVYKIYKKRGAKTTSNPTVGYGFSAKPPYAGAKVEGIGHTGVVVGVLDNGDWICANYNLNGEGNKSQERHLTYALVNGNKKSGGTIFFSGVGEPKIKSK
jgi:hypothetical protein